MVAIIKYEIPIDTERQWWTQKIGTPYRDSESEFPLAASSARVVSRDATAGTMIVEVTYWNQPKDPIRV